MLFKELLRINALPLVIHDGLHDRYTMAPGLVWVVKEYTVRHQAWERFISPLLKNTAIRVNILSASLVRALMQQLMVLLLLTLLSRLLNGWEIVWSKMEVGI